MHINRSLAIILMLILIPSMITGCRRAEFAENQAYAIMLGIDIAEKNEIELTVKYPKLAGNSGGSSDSSISSYITGTASGASFQSALNNLRLKVPAEINLSALTMVIISEELMSSGLFNDVLKELTFNYRMYSASYIAVSKSKAAEIVRNQEPNVGSRLSEAIRSMVENEERLGNIPGSRIADVYYRNDSIYSDPVIMICNIESGNNGQNDSKEQKEKNIIYSGACAVTQGRLAAEFDNEETKLINMLTGDLKQISYTHENKAYEFSVDKGPKIDISMDEIPTISVSMKLSGIPVSPGADMAAVANYLESDLYAVIKKCQSVPVEPFGFADKSASRFKTIDDWLEYEWLRKFSESDIKLEIKISEVF